MWTIAAAAAIVIILAGGLIAFLTMRGQPQPNPQEAILSAPTSVPVAVASLASAPTSVPATAAPQAAPTNVPATAAPQGAPTNVPAIAAAQAPPTQPAAVPTVGVPPALPAARYGYTTSLLATGKLLIVGGRSASGPIADVSIFDPATNAWTPVAGVATPRTKHTATVLPTAES